MERHSDIDEPVQNSSMPPQEIVGREEDTASSALSQEPPHTETTKIVPQQHRAGFWLRFVAFLIDAMILSVFALLMLVVGLLSSGLTTGLSDLVVESDPSFPLIPLWIAGILTASAAYFTILCSEQGQTIGKSLLGLEVRTSEGALLSYSQALFRWLGYGISAGFFGLGFLWVAIHPGKRSWHDLLANTIVVIPRYEES